VNYAIAAAVALFLFGFAWFAWIGSHLSIKIRAEKE
jgi:hypothetical protein